MFACVGYEFNMGYGSPRFHDVFSAYGIGLGSLRLSADISASLRLVFVKPQTTVYSHSWSPFQVEHRKTGLSVYKLRPTDCRT